MNHLQTSQTRLNDSIKKKYGQYITAGETFTAHKHNQNHTEYVPFSKTPHKLHFIAHCIRLGVTPTSHLDNTKSLSTPLV